MNPENLVGEICVATGALVAVGLIGWGLIFRQFLKNIYIETTNAVTYVQSPPTDPVVKDITHQVKVSPRTPPQLPSGK